MSFSQRRPLVRYVVVDELLSLILLNCSTVQNLLLVCHLMILALEVSAKRTAEPS